MNLSKDIAKERIFVSYWRQDCETQNLNLSFNNPIKKGRRVGRTGRENTSIRIYK
jgi:hypothetical protein